MHASWHNNAIFENSAYDLQKVTAEIRERRAPKTERDIRTLPFFLSPDRNHSQQLQYSAVASMNGVYCKREIIPRAFARA